MLIHLQLHVESVPITTKIMSSNSAHGEVYSIQHYVIMFVSGLRQVTWFSPDAPFSSTIKTDSHNMAELLLKVALNTININSNTAPFTFEIDYY